MNGAVDQSKARKESKTLKTTGNDGSSQGYWGMNNRNNRRPKNEEGVSKVERPTRRKTLSKREEKQCLKEKGKQRSRNHRGYIKPNSYERTLAFHVRLRSSPTLKKFKLEHFRLVYKEDLAAGIVQDDGKRTCFLGE